VSSNATGRRWISVHRGERENLGQAEGPDGLRRLTAWGSLSLYPRVTGGSGMQVEGRVASPVPHKTASGGQSRSLPWPLQAPSRTEPYHRGRTGPRHRSSADKAYSSLTSLARTRVVGIPIIWVAHERLTPATDGHRGQFP
jgi:hypothetical protein